MASGQITSSNSTDGTEEGITSTMNGQVERQTSPGEECNGSFNAIQCQSPGGSSRMEEVVVTTCANANEDSGMMFPPMEAGASHDHNLPGGSPIVSTASPSCEVIHGDHHIFSEVPIFPVINWESGEVLWLMSSTACQQQQSDKHGEKQQVVVPQSAEEINGETKATEIAVVTGPGSIIETTTASVPSVQSLLAGQRPTILSLNEHVTNTAPTDILPLPITVIQPMNKSTKTPGIGITQMNTSVTPTADDRPVERRRKQNVPAKRQTVEEANPTSAYKKQKSSREPPKQSKKAKIESQQHSQTALATKSPTTGVEQERATATEIDAIRIQGNENGTIAAIGPTVQALLAGQSPTISPFSPLTGQLTVTTVPVKPPATKRDTSIMIPNDSDTSATTRRARKSATTRHAVEMMNAAIVKKQMHHQQNSSYLPSKQSKLIKIDSQQRPEPSVGFVSSESHVLIVRVPPTTTPSPPSARVVQRKVVSGSFGGSPDHVELLPKDVVSDSDANDNSSRAQCNLKFPEEQPGAQNSDRPLKCAQCGSWFKTKSAFGIHLKTVHLNLKNYLCWICGAALKSAQALRGHVKKHEVPQDYKCEVFQKEHCTNSDLKQHKVVHQTMHVCNFCGKAFKEKMALQEHGTVHSERKAHRCWICGLEIEIRNKSSVSRHMQTHKKNGDVMIPSESDPTPTTPNSSASSSTVLVTNKNETPTAIVTPMPILVNTWSSSTSGKFQLDSQSPGISGSGAASVQRAPTVYVSLDNAITPEQRLRGPIIVNIVIDLIRCNFLEVGPEHQTQIINAVTTLANSIGQSVSIATHDESETGTVFIFTSQWQQPLRLPPPVNYTIIGNRQRTCGAGREIEIINLD